MEGWSFTDELNKQQMREYLDYSDKSNALGYGKWLIENCIIAREGFRIGTSNWSEVISNERAYELYLESLKSKV
jgi:hypothetical protein